METTMTRSEFKSQASLFRARHPRKPEFDAQGMLSKSDTEECAGITFVRGSGLTTFYRKRDSYEVTCRAALVHLLCLGGCSAHTIKIRLDLLKMAEFRGALPLPA
jgi:hypothetical protein